MNIPPGLFDPHYWESALVHASRISVDGFWYRLVPAAFAEAIEETGPSFARGGRYNPQGEFGALYVGENPDLCWLEMVKFFQGRTDLIPDQALGTFEIHIQHGLDLMNAHTQQQLGVTIGQITEPMNHSMTRLIGRAAWTVGIEAIRFPASVDVKRSHLAVFSGHLVGGSSVKRVSVARCPSQ